MDDRQRRGDAPAVDTLSAFACRVCNSREYVAVGRSRLGAPFYACAGCTRIFTDPSKASKPAHELVTPGLGHLFAGRTRPAGAEGVPVETGGDSRDLVAPGD